METTTISSEKSSSVTDEKSYSLGNGGFLTAPCPPGTIFTRDQLDEEQIEIGKTAREFCLNKVVPHHDKINQKAIDEASGLPLVVKLFQEAGEMGFLSISIPEAYEGMGMDMATNMHMVENIAIKQGGFANTVLPHIGIATLPILLFGNEQQKQKYLPKLGTGEWLGCYALTEPGSGSDALSGRTEARLEGDHYILNGAKQFITNGQWANVGVVFTRIDGKYSALIVELDKEGVSRGAEEKKMGIQGSSATTLTFDNVKVPQENLLGKVGDAASIALNILNLGRLELAFGVLGVTKRMVDVAISYGSERKQFGRSILDFDLQKARLADLAIRAYAADAVNYRIVAPIDQKLESSSSEQADYSAHIISAVRSYAMEASISKVLSSEALYHNSENCIKLLGGYGYIQEYEVEETFRDSFINMIYEGTNDINRLVIFDFLVRNIYSGGIPFRNFIEEVESSIRNKEFVYPNPDDDVLRAEKESVYGAKYIVAYLVQRAILRYGKDISNQQQVIRNISDSLIHLYAADSAIGRVHYRMDTLGAKNVEAEEAIAKVIVAEKTAQIKQLANEVIFDLALDYEREKLTQDLEWLFSLSNYQVNTFAHKRTIAETLIEKGRYCF